MTFSANGLARSQIGVDLGRQAFCSRRCEQNAVTVMAVGQINGRRVPCADLQAVAARPKSRPNFGWRGFEQMRKDIACLSSNIGSNIWPNITVESDVLDGTSRNQQAVCSLQH